MAGNLFSGSGIEVGDWLSEKGPNGQPVGLFVDDGKAVPLKRRDILSTVYAEIGFCDTVETMAFISDMDCSVSFKFPLPPKSAVYK